MYAKIKIITFLFLILILGGWVSNEASAQSVDDNVLSTIDKYELIQIDASNFPEIILKVRVVDDQGEVKMDIQDVAVREGGAELKIKETRLGALLPSCYMFVLDRGNYSLLNEQIISEVFDEYLETMRDELDYAGLLITESGFKWRTAVDLTNSYSVFQTGVDALDALDVTIADDRHYALGAIEGASAMLNQQDVCEDTNRAIIYIGRGTDHTGRTSEMISTIEAFSETLREQSITFHALLTSPSSPSGLRDLAKLLSEGAGGISKEYPNGVYERRLALQSFFEAVDDRNQAIEVVYRTQSGQPGSRDVSIFQPGTIIESNRVSYSPPPLTNPTIRIINSLQVARQSSDGGETFDLSELPIEVEVEWGDEILREIEQIEFFVGDEGAEGEWIPFENETFRLDIGAYITQGKHYETLQVRVVDELGFDTVVSHHVEIDVIVLPQTPTAASTPEVTAASTPEVTATSASTPPPVDECSLPLQVDACISEVCGGNTAACVITVISVGGFLIAIVLVYYFRRQVQHNVQAFGSAVASAANLLTTLIVGDRIRTQHEIAELHFLHGRPEDVGNVIKLYDNINSFGRDLAVATHEIHGSSSKPVVSRKHFTIRYSSSMQDFSIQDEGSSNNTYLDGKPLMPMEWYPLRNHQKIRIGQLYQGGVQFEFSTGNDTLIDGHAEPVDDDPTIFQPPSANEWQFDDISSQRANQLQDELAERLRGKNTPE